jgi:RsiW-degrading membrane proteinase PrsW (M82 family)
MIDQSRRTWWVENLLRPVLIAAMMTCLAAPLVAILALLLPPGWDTTYFLVFSFFAGLEGILSERVLKRRRISGWEYLASRAAEFLILVLLLKLVNYAPLGLEQLWADAQAWPSDPARFWTSVDILTILILFPLWVGALAVARQASELDADEEAGPAPPDKTSTEYYLWLTQPPPVRHRQEALHWLGEVFMWGGISLLVASALIYTLLPTASGSVLTTLLYFVLGIALLSQARFSVTRAGWQSQGIPVQSSIGRRWLLWATIFLVGVALVAMLLPTQYTMGPLLALLYFLGLIAQVAVAIITLVPYLLGLLVSLLFPGIEPPAQPTGPQELMPPAAPIVDSAPPPWLEVLVSVIFWTLILTIVGYAFLRFVRDRLGLLEPQEDANGTWKNRVWTWLQSLWHWWRSLGQSVQNSLSRRLARPSGASRPPSVLSRFFSLRRLSPRGLIRYYYLSIERRAARAGKPRSPGQTPYEYQASLDGQFPDLEPDLTGLTDAFIQARYSPQPMKEQDAVAVKPLWQRIKSALRNRRTEP